MGFARQEYWSGRPCPSLGYLPNPEIKPRSPALWVDALPSEPLEKFVQLRSRKLFYSVPNIKYTTEYSTGKPANICVIRDIFVIGVTKKELVAESQEIGGQILGFAT